MAKVKILPEVSLGSPLDDVIPMSHFRPRTKFGQCNVQPTCSTDDTASTECHSQKVSQLLL